MEKSFERLSAIVFVITLIAFSIWVHSKIAGETEIIRTSGIEVRAKVTQVFYAHGSNLNVNYLYKCRRYSAFMMVKDSSYEIGDSVLLRLMPKGQSWTGAIIYKKRIYMIPRN